MLGDRDAPVVDAGQHLVRIVHAAVVDDHDLDVARIVDVEDSFDGGADGCRLVVGGHQDRQLQP